MKKTDIVLNSIAFSRFNSKNILKEGSTVLVKIIKHTGNNSYIASLGGRRVTVKSDNVLKEGSSFKVKIKPENNKIFLLKQNNTSNQILINRQDADYSLNTPLSFSLSSYLKKIGLIPDTLSKSIFQQMIQLGMKFNLSELNKIRVLSHKFLEKKEFASQTALILKQKSIEINSKNIEPILKNDFFDKNNNESSEFKNNKNDFSITKSENKIKEVFKSFFCSLLQPQNNSCCMTRKTGLLTIFNHLGYKELNSGCSSVWIKLPFEFSCLKDNSAKYAKGVINILLGKNKKYIEKAVLNFNYGTKKYFFVLYYGIAGCTKIVIPSSEENEILGGSMQKYFPNSKIIVHKADDIFDFYAEPITFCNSAEKHDI